MENLINTDSDTRDYLASKHIYTFDVLLKNFVNKDGSNFHKIHCFFTVVVLCTLHFADQQKKKNPLTPEADINFSYPKAQSKTTDEPKEIIIR